MNKTWLIVILLALATPIVLAFTWQNIPYLNTAVNESGVLEKLAEAKTAIENLDPKSLVGIISGSVGSFLLIGKSLIGKIRESREQANQLRVGFQDEKGTLLAGFNDAKEALTGNISDLKEEYASLEGEVTVLKETIGSKDEKIIEVQSELGKVQAQLIVEQDALKNTIKEMDEYRIALEQKSVPTSN